MRVRMKVDVSGTHDGQPWPSRGEVVELDPQIATDMIRAGLVEPVTGRAPSGPVETATAPSNVETREPIRVQAEVGKPRRERAPRAEQTGRAPRAARTPRATPTEPAADNPTPDKQADDNPATEE